MSAFDKLKLKKPIQSPEKELINSERARITPPTALEKEITTEQAAHQDTQQKLPIMTRTVDGVVFPRLHKKPLQPYKAARDEEGRFRPGASGNPLGRPPSFSEYIRLMTDDGRELVDHALECVRGWVTVRWEDETTGVEHERRMPADPRYQLEARAWLAERGYGKAVQPVDVQANVESATDYTKLSADELRQYLALESKAAGKALISGGLSQGTGLTSPVHQEENRPADDGSSPTLPPGDSE